MIFIFILIFIAAIAPFVLGILCLWCIATLIKRSIFIYRCKDFSKRVVCLIFVQILLVIIIGLFSYGVFLLFSGRNFAIVSIALLIALAVGVLSLIVSKIMVVKASGKDEW